MVPLLSRLGKPWLRWLPFLVLLLAAIILWLAWHHLPERWVIHWGRHGRPDGWVRKTPLAAFFPIGFGVFLCGVLEGIAVFLLAYPQLGKQGRMPPHTAAAITALSVEGMRIISVGFALLFATLALALPLGQPVRSEWLVLSLFGLIFAAIAVSMWRMWRKAQVLRARGLLMGLEGWHGMIYRNARDPRLWVPKIAGIGYTLNFAHRRAWWWLLAFLSFTITCHADDHQSYALTPCPAWQERQGCAHLRQQDRWSTPVSRPQTTSPPCHSPATTLAFGTCRAPHSPRNWRVASMMGKMPYIPECV